MFPLRAAATVAALSLTLGGLTAAPARADDGDPVPDAGVVVYDKGDAGFECFRIPAIIKAADGSMLAFAEARRDHPGKGYCYDDGSIDLVMKRSTDRGHTWSEMTTVLAGDPWGRDVGATRGNPSPVLVTRGEHAGRIVLLSTYNVAGSRAVRLPFVQYSDDNGRTWSEAVDLTEQLKEGLPEEGWFATGPQHAIELQNGPHAGRLVVGLSISYTTGGEKFTYGAIGWSDDGGVTWHRGAMARPPKDADHFSEVGLVETATGAVLAIARSRKGPKEESMPYSRVVNVSRDGGESFSAPRFRYESSLPTTAEVQGSVLNRDSHVPAAGPVLFYAAPTHPTQRKYLSVFVSTNAGRTWDRRWEVTSDRSGYSDLVMWDAEHLGVLYETGLESGDARDTIRYKEVWTERLGV